MKMAEPRSEKNCRLVTHFIAGYPDLESSYEMAMGLIEGGAGALEMQIPFSDPSADGPVIEEACRQALASGFRVDDAFTLAKRIRLASRLPVYLMSYAGIVYNRGIRRFVGEARAAGFSGLIIPDLIPGADEGLYREGSIQGMPVVPVVVPGLPGERLEEILAESPEWVYLALRSGITGAPTILDNSNLGFLDQLKGYGIKVMAGFGIRSYPQVEILQPHCEAVVVGSYLVEEVFKGEPSNRTAAAIRQRARQTLGTLLTSD
jgi:tryptophan synthase alpha chain